VIRWWAGTLGFVLSATLAFAATAPIASTRISDEVRAILDRDYEIVLIVTPHRGDAWSRLAKRVTGDADNWKDIAEVNHAGENLVTDQPVRVPFSMLRPELQRQIITTLFPSDQKSSAGWTHKIVGGGIEGESLWKIAEWLTGDGANYVAIRAANPAQPLSTHRGDTILIPRRLLSAAFSGGTEDVNAAKAAKVRKVEDDPVERAVSNEAVPEAAVEVAAGGLPSLTYDRVAAEPYAVYRLQKGEALYSSVAIRFTGRVYARDVNEVVDRIVKFNGIEDVARIPIGHAVKIPMDLLLPEYRPMDDPARVAREQSRRESAKLARRVEAKNLAGVHIILDAGHGGRDVGTIHDGLWESSFVYDVMCRLKEILEEKSAANVWTTTRSKHGAFRPSDRDVLAGEMDHVVLTSPRYLLDDPIVGVNLRWYLANSIFRKALRKGVADEKVVFISIHADSLHPSLRGAMAYIPAERFVTGSYSKADKVYLARAEVRESPTVTQSEKEALEAEGLSRDLAESVLEAMGRSGLKVHPFNPVRDNVVREGREWVPAVIRYNKVPTRMLLEVCNLGNSRDLSLMKTKRYRQALAEAIYAGVVDFFGEADDRPRDVTVAAEHRGSHAVGREPK
jgi:N-acetylmuramoyl-L-alanine amidase